MPRPAGQPIPEIEEAVRWASGDAEHLGKSGRSLSPAAGAVYDILSSDPAFLAGAGPRPPRRQAGLVIHTIHTLIH